MNCSASGRAAGLLVLACMATPFANALTFNFSYSGSIDPQALAGFQAAAAVYQNLFSDNITVNLKIGFSNLGSSILGQSSSNFDVKSYASFLSAIQADKTSSNDVKAVAGLQTGSSFDYWTNRFSNNPNGAGSMAAYKTSASYVELTYANAKALGLRGAQDPNLDGEITFNSAFGWDFDRTDGISSNQYDFIGIAIHEIGHSLGFVSGVDFVDYSNVTSVTDSYYAWVNPLDMFRFKVGLADPYLCAGTEAKYFSLDKGLTGSSNLFSTGVNLGDGRQASHWKDNLGLGIMDPTVANGELLSITHLDILAFDVIGYNVQAVPEPASIAALAVGGLTVLFRRRKK